MSYKTRKLICLAVLALAAAIAITLTMLLVKVKGLPPSYIGAAALIILLQLGVVVLMTITIRTINKEIRLAGKIKKKKR